MKRPLACLLLSCLMLPAAEAGAQTMRASYSLTMLGGMTIAEMDAVLSLEPEGYRIETRTRPRGMARLFAPGEQTSLVDGRWGRAGPEPRHYMTQGAGRSGPRYTELAYTGGIPTLVRIEPGGREEREPVPPELTAGTLDALSVLAKLTRQVAETGACDGQAAIYDGRRRSDAVSRTIGWYILPPNRREEWSGRALLCGFESRMIAGFKRDDDREAAARPFEGRAWIAPAEAGRPPLPVRVEFETRWFGTVTAQLAMPPVLAAQGR